MYDQRFSATQEGNGVDNTGGNASAMRRSSVTGSKERVIDNEQPPAETKY